jgi:hypothetical protein
MALGPRPNSQGQRKKGNPEPVNGYEPFLFMGYPLDCPSVFKNLDFSLGYTKTAAQTDENRKIITSQ